MSCYFIISSTNVWSWTDSHQRDSPPQKSVCTWDLESNPPRAGAEGVWQPSSHLVLPHYSPNPIPVRPRPPLCKVETEAQPGQ